MTVLEFITPAHLLNTHTPDFVALSPNLPINLLFRGAIKCSVLGCSSTFWGHSSHPNHGVEAKLSLWTRALSPLGTLSQIALVTIAK